MQNFAIMTDEATSAKKTICFACEFCILGAINLYVTSRDHTSRDHTSRDHTVLISPLPPRCHTLQLDFVNLFLFVLECLTGSSA